MLPLLTLISTALALPDRGIWMHYHDGDPLGTSTIIGDPGAEALALTRFASWGITRVYGGYRDLPTDQRAEVAAWNASLSAAGIESELLLGEAHQIFPGSGCRGALLANVTERLVEFDLGVPGSTAPLAADERFVGLHLDLEPQQFKASNYSASPPPTCAPTAMYWSGPTRALLFEHLYDTLVEVRQLLDTSGHAGMPIAIDLAYWVDTSPEFDWSTTADFASGADWLQQTTAVVDGITLMTYENDDALDIRTDISGEQALVPAGYPMRPALNAKERAAHSSILTWTYRHELKNVLLALESSVGGPPQQVDLHNYRYLFSAWPLTEAVATAVEIANGSYGSPILVDHAARARLRPENLQRELAGIDAVALAGGCPSPASNPLGGSYGPGVGSGATGDGRSVVVRHADGQVTGTVDGLPFGQRWNGVYGTQAVADLGQGYLAAHWVRVQGRRGVWVGLEGTCEPGIDARALFTP